MASLEKQTESLAHSRLKWLLCCIVQEADAASEKRGEIGRQSKLEQDGRWLAAQSVQEESGAHLFLSMRMTLCVFGSCVASSSAAWDPACVKGTGRALLCEPPQGCRSLTSEESQQRTCIACSYYNYVLDCPRDCHVCCRFREWGGGAQSDLHRSKIASRERRRRSRPPMGLTEPTSEDVLGCVCAR